MQYARRSPVPTERAAPTKAAERAKPKTTAASYDEQQKALAPDGAVDRSRKLDASTPASPEVDDGVSGGKVERAAGLEGKDATAAFAEREGELVKDPTLAAALETEADDSELAKSTREEVADALDPLGVKDAAAAKGDVRSLASGETTDPLAQIAGMSQGPDASSGKNATTRRGQQSDEPAAKEPTEKQDPNSVGAAYDRDGIMGVAGWAWARVQRAAQPDVPARMGPGHIGTRGRPTPDAEGGGHAPAAIPKDKKKTARAVERMRKKMVGGPEAKAGARFAAGLMEAKRKERTQNNSTPVDDPTAGTRPTTARGTVGPGRVTPLGLKRDPKQPVSGAQPGGPAPDDPTQTTNDAKTKDDPRKAKR